jgi:hypothetical protein
VERVAEAQATARALDHRCNVEAARATTEQRLNKEDRRGALVEALVRRRAIAAKASTPHFLPALAGTRGRPEDLHLLPWGRRATPPRATLLPDG